MRRTGDLRPHRRPSAALIVAVVALIVALGGVGIAAIPSSDGTIHACYTTGANGRFYLVDTEAGGTCGAGETAISWNQRGPIGPAGPTGPAGDPGPPGPSEAVLGSHDKPVGITTTDHTVAQLALKPGSYVVLAKLGLINTGFGEVPVTCTLHAGSTTDRNFALVPRPYGPTPDTFTGRSPTQSMSFELVHRFTGRRGVGAVRISCHYTAHRHDFVASGDAEAFSMKITAIAVDSVAASSI